MTSSNMLYAMYMAAPELFDRRLEDKPRWHQRPFADRHGSKPEATKPSGAGFDGFGHRPGLLRRTVRNEGIGATLVRAWHRLGKPFSR